MNAALDAHYRAALYRVFDGAQILTTRIGEKNAAIAALLARRQAQGAVLMTAWNPGSQPLPATQNAAREAEFEAALNQAGIAWIPAEGRAADGSWIEPGVLAFDLPADQAQQLAVRYGQNAWVAYAAEGRAELVYRQSR